MNVRRLLYIFPLLTLLFTSCNKNFKDKNNAPASTEANALMPVKEINSTIENEVTQTGSFEWKNASLTMVWSALQQQSDRMMCIGYKPVSEENADNKISALNLYSAEWQDAKQQVLKIILESEKKINPVLTMQDLEVWKEEKLPVIDVKILNIETIKRLRESRLIRYIEPMGYDPLAEIDNFKTQSGGIGFGGSGCGGYVGNSGLIAGTDYTTISPNTKVSWNYMYHNIKQAWTKTTGAGITVMVIDTGVDPDQNNLGSDFNQGQSTNRTIQKIVTLPKQTSGDDGCGHGTTMSGAIAAPRGTDGNSCGVAYNCNLIICRAAQDVYIDQSVEVKGVSDAFTYAADNADVKIISLSLGRITSSGQIKDAIQYAYGKGKLMFCAGGTSFSWATGFVGVIFPASLPQVEAVTGVKDNAALTACEDCHKGRQIDFVIVMEQNATGAHPISTAINGDVPTTVGGSSVSTATAAGIAALVWSRFPTFSREDILKKLTTTASLYPNKSKNFGWGKLNADAATN